ncbi:DsbA family protein [Nocardioides pantholopis]|uniref:DsbA family protein n=1 Tax=Nocardioides pantholopis TaxID=2483798 RepID=UPI000F085E2D|nr:thioredoxin domain-containing protein [Nocardioides pantholopis]
MSNKNATASRSKRAAEAVREQEREERRRRWLMIGGVVVALVAIVVAGTFALRATDPTKDVEAPAAGAASSGVQEYGVSIGDPDAPRKVVIYEDFLCPFCGDLEAATREDLVRLADEGKVFVEFRPFELLGGIGDYSARVTNAFAVVLQEAGAEQAKAFHDIAFEEQPDEGGPYPDDDELVEWAVAAGADEEAVRDAITEGTQQEWVDRATQSAEDAGVRSTPTVLVDGEVFQAGGTAEELGEALVEELDG